MYTIHNAVDDMIQDMDLGGHYKADIIEDGNAHIVAVSACVNPQKQVAFRVGLENDKVRVRIVHQSQISPLFAQLILENLAIQLDPNYFM
jgi:transketolase C-terminal domain/subunit